jgi:hypothetical protein
MIFFSISYDILSTFSKNVERFTSSNKFIYILNHYGFITFFASGVESYIYLKTDIKANDDFNVGIDSDRFLSFSKKLYEGDIHFTINRNDLVLSKDNIKIRFPVMSLKTYIPKFTGVLVKNNKEWLLDSLCNSWSALHDKSKGLDKKFYGVLLENDANFCKICRFSNSAIYVSINSPVFSENKRVAVSDLLIKSVKAIRSDISDVFLSENSIGFSLNKGLFICANNVSDTYPENYMQHLQLAEKESLLSYLENRSKFCSNILFNAFDLVSSALGDQDFWIKISVVGTDKDNLNIWRVFGRSSMGIEAFEDVVSDSGGSVGSFSVHKLSALKALSIFSDVVYLSDLSYSSVALSNVEGSEVVLLTKTNV